MIRLKWKKKFIEKKNRNFCSVFINKQNFPYFWWMHLIAIRINSFRFWTILCDNFWDKKWLAII